MTGEYIIYRCPDGSILTDWNGGLWKHGLSYYPKSHCLELERGICEGGKNLPALHAKMKEKYGGAK